MTTRNARNRCAGERDAREQLSNEHAIAVAVETVSRLDGVAIGAKNIFAAGERGNQSNQAGLRQMKVGEHLRDDAEDVYKRQRQRSAKPTAVWDRSRFE